jgi:hypothetical protein
MNIAGKVGQILYPPDIVEIEGPMVFLAGPIQGAPQWQAEAERILRQLDRSLHVANPRHGNKVAYEDQVDWETHFLRRAALDGVVLFWLAKEETHQCDRAYAQTSRFEIGEWKERCVRGEARLAVGIEGGFSNARYIRRRFAQDCPKVEIQDTLEATCKIVADPLLLGIKDPWELLSREERADLRRDLTEMARKRRSVPFRNNSLS